MQGDMRNFQQSADEFRKIKMVSFCFASRNAWTLHVLGLDGLDGCLKPGAELDWRSV